MSCSGQGNYVASPALRFFLENDIDRAHFTPDSETLNHYIHLDDSDIWCALKVWADTDDKILSLLSQDMLKRKLFEVEVRKEPLSAEERQSLKGLLSRHFDVPTEDSIYLFSENRIQKDMYNPDDDHIDILFKDGTVKDISEASELFNISLLSKKIHKYYLCKQRF